MLTISSRIEGPDGKLIIGGKTLSHSLPVAIELLAFQELTEATVCNLITATRLQSIRPLPSGNCQVVNYQGSEREIDSLQAVSAAYKKVSDSLGTLFEAPGYEWVRELAQEFPDVSSTRLAIAAGLKAQTRVSSLLQHGVTDDVYISACLRE